MRYDEIMQTLASISSRYETMLEVLSDTIGFEYTEELLKPLFEHILPAKDSMAAENFIKAVEEIASKLFFYKEAESHDVYYSRLEEVISNFETSPEDE